MARLGSSLHSSRPCVRCQARGVYRAAVPGSDICQQCIDLDRQYLEAAAASAAPTAAQATRLAQGPAVDPIAKVLYERAVHSEIAAWIIGGLCVVAGVIAGVRVDTYFAVGGGLAAVVVFACCLEWAFRYRVMARHFELLSEIAHNTRSGGA